MQETGKLIEEIKSTRSIVACTRLVDKYKRQVYSFCYGMVKDEQIAEEIAQDAFLKALDRLPSLKEPEKFYPWMMRLTYHLTIDFIRKKNIKHESIELAAHMKSTSNPYLDMVDLDRQQLIQGVLTQLPLEDRSVVTLFYMDDLTVKEIEKITGLSQSNIKIKLFRSRETLRKQFQKIYNQL